MKNLITILDNITETSMPFNEFVLYRANHKHEEKQILVVCGPSDDLPAVKIPSNLTIVYAGKNPLKIRTILSRIISELENNHYSYAIHLHQVQSGFLSEIAMVGTNFHKKVVFTVHSTFSGYKFHNKVLSFTNALCANRITCVSNISYQDYPKFIKWIKKDHIQAIQNGVDIERIDMILTRSEPATHDYVNFIYVARYSPLKNHTFLVDVLPQCNQSIHFTFVGEEDANKEVRKKAESLGVANRISFTGLLPRCEVFKLLQNADYYISASMLEGLPVSVLEAMCCGLPCILSDIPQHREAVGSKALLLPLDVDRWSEELNRLITIPKTEYEKWSSDIREYVINNFSLNKMHQKYDMIYKLL